MIEATASPTNSPAPDYRILDVSGDQLHVVGHGLGAGDSVEYDNGAPGSSAITGLVGSQYGTDDDGHTRITTVTVRRTYNVIPGTDGDHLYLGSTFDGQSCTSTTTSCVNLARDTITFDGPSNLATGDAVHYVVPTGSTTIGGLTTALGHLLRRRPRRPHDPARRHAGAGDRPDPLVRQLLHADQRLGQPDHAREHVLDDGVDACHVPRAAAARVHERAGRRDLRRRTRRRRSAAPDNDKIIFFDDNGLAEPRLRRRRLRPLPRQLQRRRLRGPDRRPDRRHRLPRPLHRREHDPAQVHQLRPPTR